MAAMRPFAFPVRLECGPVEAEIGEVSVPAIVKAGPAEGDVLPFSIEADMPVFRARLAALLRKAAEEIEAHTEPQGSWISRPGCDLSHDPELEVLPGPGGWRDRGPGYDHEHWVREIETEGGTDDDAR